MLPRFTTSRRWDLLWNSSRQLVAQAPDIIRDIFDLSGSVAFVTGGSRGIGRETCLALAKAGADIMITDYNPDTHKLCDDLIRDIRELNRKALSCICDVTDFESVKRAVSKCKEKLGSVDILVANAGILGSTDIPQELDPTNWRKVFATNVDGVFHCCRAVHPVMKERGRGKVIIMSAIERPFRHTAFTTSKGAVIPLAKSLAVAWAPHNIQVNCILPGAIDTEFNVPILATESEKEKMVDGIPAGRLGAPKDIIGAILFYSSRASDYCTGSQLVVDGGLSLSSLSGKY